MLVLSRKVGEDLNFTIPPGTEPRDMKVRVVEVKGGKVRLGIEAPKEIVVLRDNAQQTLPASASTS